MYAFNCANDAEGTLIVLEVMRRSRLSRDMNWTPNAWTTTTVAANHISKRSKRMCEQMFGMGCLSAIDQPKYDTSDH